MSDSPKLTVKEMDLWQQPREKAEKYGYHTLSKSELLALILRTGLPGCPITRITSELLASCENSLHLLMRKSVSEIKKTAGMGPVKAGQVMAILELIKQYGQEEAEPDNEIIRDSKSIYNLLRFELANLNKEEIWMLSLNRRNAVISRHKVTRGSSIASVFDLHEVMKLALIDEATGVVLCHNHPSGNLKPSASDDAITRKLKNACELLDITFLDHVIISYEGYYSYHDEGRL